MIDLKEYQVNAVEELVNNTLKLFTLPQKHKSIVFKSPTGSGKTVMLSKYIDSMANNEDLDVCFLWISIGTGSLHEQSKNRITEVLEGNPSCKLLEEVIPDGEIGKNQVVIINWEKLNRKKDGAWDNVIMREGEKTNFDDVIGKTLEKRKIILIIDESHRGADTKTSEELKSLIQSEVIINMSATPQYIPPQSAKHEKYIEVPIEDVIAEGVIKKEVLINDTVDDAMLNSDSEGVLEFVLNMAIKRRESLKDAYVAEGRNINPLCLIQIPNSDKGESTLNELISLLEKNGISLEDKNLAIWTSKESSNLEGLSDYDSNVDYLIFKMAVATGWDCPRAQVLLKLREVKSEVFDIQTIGRILRMPERIHYNNELLNKAYIYTNENDIKVNIENLSMVKWLKLDFRKDIENVELSSYYKRNDKNMLINRPRLDEIFKDVLDKSLQLKKENTSEKNSESLKKNGITLNFDSYKQKIIKNRSIEVHELDSGEFSSNEDNSIGEIEATPMDTLKAFKASLQNASPRMYESFISMWGKIVGEMLGIAPRESGRDTRLMRLYLNNQARFESIFSQTKSIYESEYSKLMKPEEFNFLFSINAPEIKSEDGMGKIKANKYIFSECYLKTSRSQPEKNFEEFLEENGDRLSWWYKNEDSGRENFGIKYELDGTPHTFYPDYIVRFADGRIGIFETKSANEDSEKTKAKAKALQAYLGKEAERSGGVMLGGIVASSDKKAIVINQSNKYTSYAKNPEQWTLLSATI